MADPHANAKPRIPTPRALLTGLLCTIEETPAAGYALIVKRKEERQRVSKRGAKRQRLDDGDDVEGRESSSSVHDDSDEDSDASIDSSTGRPKPRRWALPTSHRRLLMTLHTILPALVMPALDLLDRGLLTRLLPHPPRPGYDPHGVKLEDDGDDEVVGHQGIYIARSLASAQPRRGRPGTTTSTGTGTGTGGGTTEYIPDDDTDEDVPKAPPPRYITRLGAWNCTCAEFAMSTFREDAWHGVDDGVGIGVAVDYAIMPLSELSSDNCHVSHHVTANDNSLGVANDDNDRPSNNHNDSPTDNDSLCLNYGRGTYGGLSLDGTERGIRFFDTPCCKHLFAGLLVERWGEVLESRVKVRYVTREEMAGLVAGM